MAQIITTQFKDFRFKRRKKENSTQFTKRVSMKVTRLIQLGETFHLKSWISKEGEMKALILIDKKKTIKTIK